MIEGNVVQFNERHKWCGCLGIIEESKPIYDEKGHLTDVRFMVGVPMPMQGTAYIFVMESEMAIEGIGKAIMIPKSEEKKGDNNE